MPKYSTLYINVKKSFGFETCLSLSMSFLSTVFNKSYFVYGHNYSIGVPPSPFIHNGSAFAYQLSARLLCLAFRLLVFRCFVLLCCVLYCQLTEHGIWCRKTLSLSVWAFMVSKWIILVLGSIYSFLTFEVWKNVYFLSKRMIGSLRCYFNMQCFEIFLMSKATTEASNTDSTFS